MPSAADDAARQVDALATRQQDILARIARLEATLGPSTAAAALTTQVDADASPVHRRLQEELISKGILNHRFVRAPPDYYDRPLEFRQGVLQAASVHHLCKSIIMENTRVEAGERSPSDACCSRSCARARCCSAWQTRFYSHAYPLCTAGDPGVTKYYLIVCQYSARLHSEKLRSHVHSAHSGALAKGKINMRLCPEAVSDELTGFEHNAVSPIGIRTQLPILMSHRIAALQPDFFWLGGGEVDLKVGLSARDFMAAYNPQVVDCTYSDDEEGGQ